MRQVSFNDGWAYRHLAVGDGAPEEWTDVTLPHDAMISEPRDELAASGLNSGWFEGRDYEYARTLEVGEDLAGKALVLEFEGVYRLAEVWVNGELACERPYGYTNFCVDLTGLVHEGPNEVRVVARNSDQPNSRWYSGAGIYRPVTLWVGEKDHVELDGICVRTASIEPASVVVDVACTAPGRLRVDVVPAGVGAKAAPVTSSFCLTDADGRASMELGIPDARLWSPDAPNLYECRVRYDSAAGSHDEAGTTFGIRTLEWGNEGLLLNGERLLLQGACIHHDNGILGACAYADSEERKVRLMQAQGYNALRSAHNPCSKALLDACDRLGMLVMDEYIDHWYIHKTQYDYVDHFDAWWRQDLADMVMKDRNHPCVALYSTGNEVSETAEERGIELARQMTEYLHGLDPTRPVTCGVNIFFNFLSSIGFGQYSDEKAAKEAREAEKRRAVGAKPKKRRAVGSEFFNNMAGLLGADFMKRGASLPFCDGVTRDAFAAMDIAGYNYGIDRYEHDLRKYPHRLILGSETFCSDAYRFRELAKREPHLVGDFVWAGMDYLGETGIGSWEYEDYAKRQVSFGWLTAGSGRVDLTGKPLGEAYYTRVALEADPGPYMAVCPVNHTGDKHSPSAWKMSNATDSWSWEGCEGRAANVEVYARAARVKLLLNGREVASRRMRDDCVARMTCTYEPGVLEAVTYDEHGRELGRCSLTSAGTQTRLVAEVEYAGGTADPERARCIAAGHLAFVRVRYADDAGITKPLERGTLHAEVTGGELLGFGCAAPYNEGSFVTGETGTYYGEALAVVRAPKEVGGNVCVTVTDGKLESELAIPVV